MSAKKSNEVFSEIIVGIFMIAVLSLLVYFTIIISGASMFGGNSKVSLNAMFENVGGLKARDSVILRGMPVGTVESMHLEQGGVRVTLALQPDVVLREGYRLTVHSGSLLGGNYLLIEEGEGDPLPKDAALTGIPPSDWMRDLGEVVAQLKEAAGDGGIKRIIANLEETTDSIKTVVARLEEGKGTLGKLLSEDMALYNDLSEGIASLRSVATKIDTGDNSLGRLLNDDGNVYTNLSASIANLKSLSDRLENGEGTLGKLLSADDSIYRDLQDTMEHLKNVTARVDAGEGSLGKLLADDSKIYDDLDATMANLRVVTDRLANGEGTLGKLAADEELYSDVHGLIKDVRQTVDNFRDTTPISAFASLIMGGL